MVFSDIAHKAFGFNVNSKINAPDGLTLEMVLQDQTLPPFSLQDFTLYLKTTYCLENLSFYEAVTTYKTLCRTFFGQEMDCDKIEPVVLSDGVTLFNFSGGSESQRLSKEENLWFETLKNKFESILQTFILSDAPQEINIPYDTRHQLLYAYQQHQLYHPALFYPACSAVIELLRISAFIPFATDPNRTQSPPLNISASISTSTPSSSSSNYYYNSNGSKPTLTRKPKSSTSLTPLPSEDNAGFMKRFTTSFRFRSARSPSPPRHATWRQINIPDLSQFKTTQE
jgi:hypothetical protein